MQQVAERRKVLSVLDEQFESYYGEAFEVELLGFKQRAFDNGWGITNIATFSLAQWCGLEVPAPLADNILTMLTTKRIKVNLLPAESPRGTSPEATTPTVGANPNGPLAWGSQGSSNRASGLGAAGGSGGPAASGSGGSAAGAPGSAGVATRLGPAPRSSTPVQLRPATTSAVAATGPPGPPPGPPAGSPPGSVANRHLSPGHMPWPSAGTRCRHRHPNLPAECWILEPLRTHELEGLYGADEVKSMTSSLSSNIARSDPLWDLTTRAWNAADQSVFFTENMLGVPMRNEPTYWMAAWWGGKKSNNENRYIEMGCRACGYRTNRIHCFAPFSGSGPSNMDLLVEAFKAFFEVR